MKRGRQSNLVRAAHRAGALVAAMAVLMSLVLMPAPVRAATIVHVVSGGAGDGSDWANGKDLQAALTDAASGDELWLKVGSYLPTMGTDRTASFVLKSGVAVYGGFTGTETQRSQRTGAPHETILSGNIGTTSTFEDNSYNVVTADGTDASAVLDNVQILGGYADGPTVDDQITVDYQSGAGLRADQGSPTLSNVNFAGNTAQERGGGVFLADSESTMTNITFLSNYARSGGGLAAFAGDLTLADVDFVRNTADFGGGMYTDYGSPTLTNVSFSGNRATNGGGGGMYANNGSSRLTHVSFSGNTASTGAGMYTYNSLSTLTHVSFLGNTANYDGGGMYAQHDLSTLTHVSFLDNTANYDGGGMLADHGSPTLSNVSFSGNAASMSGGGVWARNTYSTLTNVSFSGNSATNGGGMYAEHDSSTLTNVSFSGNSATNGGGMYVYNGADRVLAKVRNSILWENSGGEITAVNSTVEVQYSLVQGGFPGTNNLAADPLFVDAAAGDLRLSAGSPAINAGSNALLRTDVETDLDGLTRVVGGAVDLGAYEYPTSPAPALSSISPLGAQAGGAAFPLTVSGSNFVPGSAVQWRDTAGAVTPLATTFNSVTTLTAEVPAGLVANAQTAEISVVTPAPGGGASGMLPFFVTATDTTVTNASTGSSQDGTATANISGLTATATGTGSVTVAEYAANPAGTPSFNSSGVYFDVYVSSGNTFTSVSIVQCTANGGTQAYWWDGIEWVLASQQQYDAATGCITITVDSTTSPSLGDLFGTIFAVENVAPTVAAITGAPGDPIPAGTAVNITSSFSDPAGALDGPYAVAIDWGDGTTPDSSTMSTSGPIGGSHTYTAASVYTVKVTVSDKEGGTGTATTSQYVVVYDPSAGFVTGGGWIDSPAGAYAADPMLTGKAGFGFVSKYQKGATTPAGQTQFRFHAGSLDFHSTAYQWLVISGAKAQYKGEGLLNGSGGYGFMLTANDGQVSGGGAVDRFRIKIWEKATGSVVYDNQMGDAEDAAASTAIQGGSIVVHSK